MMEYTIREMIKREGIGLEDTDYRYTDESVLDFRLFTGNFYEWEERKLLFKKCVTIMDYSQLADAFPPFSNVKYKSRRLFPYYVGEIETISEALKKGKTIAVEGGPCFFGQYEVKVSVKTKDGKLKVFDYANGKAYLNQDDLTSNQYDRSREFSEDKSLFEYIRINGPIVDTIAFEQDKPSLTSQEYLNLRYPFETAAALGGPLIIPIPDMSYIKYLHAVLDRLPENVREQTLEAYKCVASKILEYYTEAITILQDEFHIKEFACIDSQDKELLNKWYNKRAVYINRKKVLSRLTTFEEKLEPIKDYVTMPALPHYIFGSDVILQMDSVDETDSYRKCKRAHKKSLQLSCIMIPELLSDDGVHTVYNAPTRLKKYGSYRQLKRDYLGS